MHGSVGREPQRRRSAGGGREHADGRAGVPALADMLWPHAQADPRPDLIAGDGGAQEIAAAHAGPQFGDREQRRQGHRAHMQHAGAVHVVEFEALHQGAVDERRMGRGQPTGGAPHRAGRGGIEPGERREQDLAPRQAGAEHGTAQRVQDQELDPRDHLGRNLLIGEPCDERRDAARLRIVAAGSVAHDEYLPSKARKPAVSITASRSLNEAMSSIIAAALPSRAIVASTRCIALMAARWVSLGMMTTW